MRSDKSVTKCEPVTTVLQLDAAITSGYTGIITKSKSIGSSTNACATYASIVRPYLISIVHSYDAPVSSTEIN